MGSMDLNLKLSSSSLDRTLLWYTAVCDHCWPLEGVYTALAWLIKKEKERWLVAVWWTGWLFTNIYSIFFPPKPLCDFYRETGPPGPLLSPLPCQPNPWQEFSECPFICRSRGNYCRVGGLRETERARAREREKGGWGGESERGREQGEYQRQRKKQKDKQVWGSLTRGTESNIAE